MGKWSPIKPPLSAWIGSAVKPPIKRWRILTHVNHKCTKSKQIICNGRDKVHVILSLEVKEMRNIAKTCKHLCHTKTTAIFMVYFTIRDNGYIAANRERGNGWVFHVVNQAHSDTIRSYIIGLYIGTHAHSDTRSIYIGQAHKQRLYIGCMN